MDFEELPDLPPLSIKDVEDEEDASPKALKYSKTRLASGAKVINGFVVLGNELGQGAYGKVKLAKSEATGEHVALKKMSRAGLLKKREFKSVPGQLRPKMTTALDKVRKEIGIMQQLSHPNVVRLLAAIDDPDVDPLILFLEYASAGQIMAWDGKALRYASKAHSKGPYGGLPLTVIRRALADTVAGLKHIHSLGIVHRDIKPDNLLVASDGTLKICDFGEADQFEGEEAKEAFCRDSKGTHHFFAPEMCDGKTEQYNGYKTDIWAVGVVLYAMFFGSVPFFDKELNMQRLFDLICTQPISVPKGFPPVAQDLLVRILNRDPASRLSLAQIEAHPFLTGH